MNSCPIIRHLVVSTFHTVSEIFFMLNPRSEALDTNRFIFSFLAQCVGCGPSRSCRVFAYSHIFPRNCLLGVPCAYVALPSTLTCLRFSSSTNHTHLQGPVQPSSSRRGGPSPPPQSPPRPLYPQASPLNCSLFHCLHGTPLTINHHLPAV